MHRLSACLPFSITAPGRTFRSYQLLVGAVLLAATALAPHHDAQAQGANAAIPSATRQPAAKAHPVREHRRRLPPPVLMVQGATRSAPLRISAVDIQARIVGHLAETTLTLTFHNPNVRDVEGDLYFPLPPGAVVSGYGLDVNGVMVDGVVVGREKARKVFEAEVRKGIDPGIVEWTRGSNFKTRIYPIPAKGTRTIRVSYVADVDSRGAEAIYRLPLAFRKPVAQLSIRVEVVRSTQQPQFVGRAPKGLQFGRWRNSQVASVKMANAKLSDDLVIRLPALAKTPVRVESAPGGRHYFAVRDTLPAHMLPAATHSKDAPHPRRIGLYWDASLSRAKLDHTQEFEVLRAYLARLKTGPVEVNLVVFRNAAERPRRFQLPAQRAALFAALKSLPYDGGTQLGSIDTSARGLGKVDLNLLFTDGISNLGRENPSGLTAPTYVINAAATANHPMLRYLALRSGGAVFQLRQQSVKDVARLLGRPTLSFIRARTTSGRIGATWPQLSQPVSRHFELAGTLLSREATLVLEYGMGGRVLHTKTLVVRRSDAQAGELLRRYWAQKKINDLLVFPERNAGEIRSVGRQFGIVTPGTSLMVLERLDQYTQHNIRPPASLPKMQRAWRKAMQENARLETARRASKLQRIIALWKSRVNWWKTRFKIPVRVKVKKLRSSDADSDDHGGLGARGTGRGGGSRSQRRRSGNMREQEEEPSASESKSERGRAKGRAVAVEMKAWNPKTPYLILIRAAPKRGQYAAYLRQRRVYGQSPAFFLDCANHFRKQKKSAISLRILSSVAELKLDDPQLMRVLAHRLAQVGQLELSIQVFTAVARLRPEDPQSHRDLALVHAKRARLGNVSKLRQQDFRQALKLLARVVMRRWDRFNEIEVIALTEFNHIWAEAKRAGVHTQPLDKRLIRHLDLDIRIVMTWDADLTDMDLHVVEPSGEEAYYGHNRTLSGGLVTRDFTRGFGPEVYAVRRAMKGKYKIRTKFYGSSAAKLIGAVTLQVDVITNYGRKNEQRRSVTLRLTDRKETFTVAEIAF